MEVKTSSPSPFDVINFLCGGLEIPTQAKSPLIRTQIWGRGSRRPRYSSGLNEERDELGDMFEKCNRNILAVCGTKIKERNEAKFSRVKKKYPV